LGFLTEKKTQLSAFNIKFKYLEQVNRKVMSMDYAILESPDGQNKKQLAYNNIDAEDLIYDNSNLNNIVNTIINILSEALGLFSYAAIILMLNPILILFLLATTLVPYYVTKHVQKLEYEYRHQWGEYGRKMNYIGYTFVNWNRLKDIILYSMIPMLLSLFWNVIEEMIQWRNKYQKKYFLGVDVVGGLLSLIRNGFAYGVLIYKVLYDGMSISDFVFYFGIVTGFSSWLSGILNSAGELNKSNLSFCDLREFLNMPDC
jgi:ABC-type bacteriocin/lantibiotic exporter with double-glycine peptidase domain